MASEPPRPDPNASVPAGVSQAAASAAAPRKPSPLRDMSQYFRTYAKDVARLTNAPMPVSTPPVAARAGMKEEVVSGVAMPTVDESPVNRPDAIRDIPRETVDITREDSAGIFARKAPAPQSTLIPPPELPPLRQQPAQPVPALQPAPVKAPSPAVPAPAPVPAPQPVPAPVVRAPEPVPLPAPLPAPKPVPAPSIPITPSAPMPQPARPAQPIQSIPPPVPEPATVSKEEHDAEREAVLARLRKKLADSRAVGAGAAATVYAAPAPGIPVPTAPAPSMPAPPVFPRRAPLTTGPTIEPGWLPPAAPRPIEAPAAPAFPAQPFPEQERGRNPLQTYSGDFAGRIDEQHASTFSVLAAQQDAGQGRAVPEAGRRRSVLPVALAVILIVLGSAGLFAAYRFLNPDTGGQQTLGVPSLIFADEKMELTGPDYRQSLADATNEPLVEGNVLVTYVTTASSTALGVAEPQPGGILIRALNLGAPDILLRNVDLLSTVGVIRAGSETRPFFILRVNSYERTFAGMLGWEQRMLSDLAPLYPAYADPVPFMAEEIASTTVPAATSSTPATLASDPVPAGFVDIVAGNHDARALKDASGRTLILYGYSDSQTLIIARDEAAFIALIARLAASASE